MKVLLRVNAGEEEPIEAVVELAIVPRRGDLIEMWGEYGSCYPVVDTVIVGSNDIEIWIKFDTFDIEEVKSFMKNVNKGNIPC